MAARRWAGHRQSTLSTSPRRHQTDRPQAGTVGHPIPGVVAKVVDVESGEVLPPDREALLLVKGPGRMLGYPTIPAKTRRGSCATAGYVTGDIAALDDEGFIRITDRLARFSKIGPARWCRTPRSRSCWPACPASMAAS